MADKYRSFAELTREQREGRDYRVIVVRRDSRVLVMAPHGGKIEPYTTELAEAIAGEDFAFFSFLGIKEGNNHEELHVASGRYDERRALELTAAADFVLTIHGQRDGSREFVMPGGRDFDARRAIGQALRSAGFAVLPPTRHLRGEHPNNICNRGRRGRGVQLELSSGLRARLREHAGRRAAFSNAVRSVLLNIERSDRGQLRKDS
ncbi:MAG: poly-gamma-glutamate hydrolase family protein [Gemmatimonadota bacterium]|nr:MAG: poly-gamma-glutamate hydrolase family protein [Gemmatimonadota bacterium]